MNTVINKEMRHAFAIEQLLKTRDEYKRTLEHEEGYAAHAQKEADEFRQSISRLKQEIAKIEDAINALTDA
jgi:hypothetical protein